MRFVKPKKKRRKRTRERGGEGVRKQKGDKSLVRECAEMQGEKERKDQEGGMGEREAV
jgi:hypothetical protein